jgi:protein phosphatase 1 regulatory subunit 42
MHAKTLLKRSQRNVRKNETMEDALRTLTHLHMAGLGISSLEPEQLNLYSSAICLYVYDNHLTDLSGIDNLDFLEELQAQNNDITEIQEFGPFVLRRLDLRHNCISVIRGLSQQPDLRELLFSGQRVERVVLSPGCFSSQVMCLTLLELADCGIDELTELRGLEALQVLNLAGNLIGSLHDLALLMSTLPSLRNLDLRRNPVCKEVKYRESMIIMSEVAELDGKEVLPTQRETLRRMKRRKISTEEPVKPKKPKNLFLVKHLA